METTHYDVVYIGNYTKDTIITPSGIRHVDGGGSRYAAYAAHRLGKKVAVVTCLAEEDNRIVEELRRAGIGCHPAYSAQSTLMNLDYPTSNPDIRTLTVAGVADPIRPEMLEGLTMSFASINASLRGEVGLDVIRALKAGGATLAADMQGYVRVLNGRMLYPEPWAEMEETLAYVDILKSDAVEAEHLTGKKDIIEAARAFAAMGPKEIVLTHKNGVLIHFNGESHDLPFHASRLDGRSGRGDTCIGTYVAQRLTMDPLEAGIWAAAVTSLKVERLGVFDRPIRDVEQLIATYYKNGRTH